MEHVLTVGDLLEFARRRRRPALSTYKNWEITCRPLLTREISAFSKDDAMDYEDEMGENLLDSTVRVRLGYLHTIWENGIKRNKIQVNNPWKGLVGGYKAPEPKRYSRITYAQMEPMHDDVIFNGLWHHGMRVMELVGISPREIVLNTDIPYFALRDNDVRDVKNGARDVPIHPDFLPYIKDIQFTDNSYAGWNWSRALKKKVGVTAHAIRHHYSRQMRRAKIDIALQGAIIGHDYGNAMVGYYGQPDLEDMLEAMISIDAYS